MFILKSWMLKSGLMLTSILAVMFISVTMSATALATEGKLYIVSLVANDGSTIKVADLRLMPKGEGYTYELTMVRKQPFQNYFLSMRPFDCLTDEATKRSLCYLNYPYQNNHFITADDLVDLEYDLLFIRRKSTDYGIDPWHGSYYKMQWEGDSIIGEVHEADLDILAAPPEDGSLRPIKESDLTPAEIERFWLPKLTIKPVNP